jgi:hypothetical protein
MRSLHDIKAASLKPEKYHVKSRKIRLREGSPYGDWKIEPAIGRGALDISGRCEEAL